MELNEQKRSLPSVLVFVIEGLRLILAWNMLEEMCTHTIASENNVVCRGVGQIAMCCGHFPEGFINNSLQHNAILVRLFLLVLE